MVGQLEIFCDYQIMTACSVILTNFNSALIIPLTAMSCALSSLSPILMQLTFFMLCQYCHEFLMFFLDPLASGCVIETKYSVHIGLPQQLPRSAGQTYLCDVALPKQTFGHIGVKYRSPFGIKFCIPLHNE